MKHRLPCCILLAVCALAARADTPPQRLLEEGRSQMASARTLSADMVLVLDDGENATAQLRLMKPNLVSIRIKNRRGDTRIFCDGREGYLVIPGKKRYVRTALDGKGRSLPTAASVFPLVAAFVCQPRRPPT